MTRPCIVVAGLGRCGSSMTMQMLHAAGVPCLGYYPGFEDEAFAPGRIDPSRLAALDGCAVKILDAWRSPRLALPNHIVIWLDRDSREQAKSMMKLIGVPSSRKHARSIASTFPRDGAISRERLGIRSSASPPRTLGLRLDFEAIVERPADSANRLAVFICANGWPPLDVEKMAAVVRPRPAGCLPWLLEAELI